jgi:hypothetical protein
MATKRDAAFTALKKIPSLNPGLHGEIVNALAAEDLVETDGGVMHAAASGLTRIERVEAEAASNPQIRQALRYAGHKLLQCGSSFDDVVDHARGEISLAKLNAAMAKKSVDFRIAVKNALSIAKAID